MICFLMRRSLGKSSICMGRYTCCVCISCFYVSSFHGVFEECEMGQDDVH
jgi:hypothetical protein